MRPNDKKKIEKAIEVSIHASVKDATRATITNITGNGFQSTHL